MSMSISDDWKMLVENETAQLESRYFTQTEFEETLRRVLEHSSCPLVGLCYEVKCPPPFEDFTIGQRVKGEIESIAESINGGRVVTLRICLKRKQITSGQPDWFPILSGLFRAYWKPQLRTESAGMPDLKRQPQAKKLAQGSIDHYLGNRLSAVFIFADLDSFGLVNKKLNLEEGDRVIKEWGALLERVSRSSAVLLHLGGDEFALVFPGTLGENALLTAYDIASAIKSHDFKIDPEILRFSVSFGISTFSDVQDPTFDNLRDAADQAKTKVKETTKGLARFLPGKKIDNTSMDLEERLDIATSLMKSTSTTDSPFENVWLNCISLVVLRTVSKNGLDIGVVRNSVKDFLGWSHINWIDNASSRACRARGDNQNFDGAPAISSIDCCVGVAHALLRYSMLPRSKQKSGYNLSISHKGKSDSAILLDSVPVWASNPTLATASKYELGDSWSSKSDIGSTIASASPAILIQIGHSNASLPSSIFAERIVVDDRPAAGGGLPDFWEATIAHLISYVERNPNISAVYVLGNLAHGKETASKLRQIGSWGDDDEQMAFKTGMSVTSIRKASSLLRGKIFFPKSERELVAHLAKLVRPRRILLPVSPQSLRSRSPLFRERMFQPTNMLSKEDGCKANTVADAYPLVLQIVRQSDVEVVKDQDERPLKELVDFKVRISNPLVSQIPSFYSREQKSFEHYFMQEFKNPTGLFGREIRKKRQLSSVMTLLVDVISNPQLQFATRRAIIIIPNQIENGTLKPLGLVAIRCIPRFTRSQIRMSYSFTWRTVEALVGFPYSMYASVRLGEHLTEQVRLRVKAKFARLLVLGEISYVAQSLHMFMEEYEQNIAKRIVDDASF